MERGGGLAERRRSVCDISGGFTDTSGGFCDINFGGSNPGTLGVPVGWILGWSFVLGGTI